jgi:hypothetical protein
VVFSVSPLLVSVCYGNSPAFRFTVEELQHLSALLELPHPLITRAGYRSLPLESFALLCARLRTLEDQWSLATKYARTQSAISEIINETASFVNARWGHLLRWDSDGLLRPERLQVYACKLHGFGAPTQSIFGFIDCTIRQTCRPVRQQELYTGYKKFHGMKFQAVVTPDGLIAHLDGPYRAPQNDSGVLNGSGLLSHIEEHAIQPGLNEGDPPSRRFYQLYGDSAYGVSPYIISPYSGTDALTPEQRAWNAAMGGVLISVEHGFGLVLQDWPYLHCFWKHKILGNACGLMYRVAILLTNAHACIEPNQTSLRYSCPPPSVDDYFHS